MADEPISSLIEIPDGGVAEAKPLRQNFNYLKGLITQQQSGLDNKLSSSTKGAANGVCPLNASSKINNNYIDFDGATSVIDSRIDDQCVKLTGNQTISGNKTFTYATYIKSTNAEKSALSNFKTIFGGNDVKPRGQSQLGNGLLFQWGYKASSGLDQNTTINFPKNFISEKDYCLMITGNRSGMGTRCPVVTTYNAGSAIVKGDTGDIYWFAIGKGSVE